MSAVIKKAVLVNLNISRPEQKSAPEKPKGELGDASMSTDVMSKTDKEVLEDKPVQVSEEDVSPNATGDRKPEQEEEEEEEEEQTEEEEEQIEEEEEHIRHLNVDEIDSSGHSEEIVAKSDNTLMSISDRVFDEDVLEYMKSLGIRGSADNLELNVLKMPSLHLVTAETKTARESRRIVIYPVSPDDMSHSTVKKILSSDSCIHYTVKCDRTGDSKAWNGCAILNFLTSSDAVAAASELRQMRRSLHIEQGTSVDSKFADLGQQLPNKDWTEMMLVVKNIGDSITEKVLKELFPDADVVIHKKDADKTAKVYAYLLYSSAERAKEVLETYSEKKLEVNGRRLFLLKWRQTTPNIMPDGMLRIGERHLVMRNLDETKAKLEKWLAKEYQQAKINFLQDLIDRDDAVRKLFGLPLPSYNQLKKLSCLRQFGESEAAHILKRLMEPFHKEREKDKAKDRDREGDREKERQRHQETTAKGGHASRGRMVSSHLDNSSSKRPPVLHLSAPIVPIKRNTGTGKQQQRTATVQPVLSTQHRDLSTSRSYDDEPYSKMGRYSAMESDQDLFSQIYHDPDQRVRAKEYDHGEPQPHYCADRGDSRDRSDDDYRSKELLSSGVCSLDVEELFRLERSLRRSKSHQGSRSLLGSAPHHGDERSRGKSYRYDERDEKRQLRNSRDQSDDRLPRLGQNSLRRQSSPSNSAEADPVSLLLNLSQLLTEKLQRFKKEKGKGGDGY